MSQVMSNRVIENKNIVITALKFDNPKTSAETYWLNLFQISRQKQTTLIFFCFSPYIPH